MMKEGKVVVAIMAIQKGKGGGNLGGKPTKSDH